VVDAWQNRAHFFAVAANMVRQILVDHARRRAAAKRGGDATPGDGAYSLSHEISRRALVREHAIPFPPAQLAHDNSDIASRICVHLNNATGLCGLDGFSLALLEVQFAGVLEGMLRYRCRRLPR